MRAVTSSDAARAALLGGGILLLVLVAGVGAAALLAARRRRRAAPSEPAVAPAAVPEGNSETRAVESHPRLTLLTGPSAGTAYRLRPSTTIGRSSESNIAIDDLSASRRHALVTGRGGEWVLEDLGSANGTWVNRARIGAPMVLSPGDAVTIGTTSFRFEFAPAPPEAPALPLPTSPAAWAPTLPSGMPGPRPCAGCGAMVFPGMRACPACGAQVP